MQSLGRFILMYLPDPVAVLRSISQLVRPGGVFVFQEPTWVPVIAHLAALPLWFATASLIDKTMRTSANHDMGAELYHTFVEAGLPAPTVRLELPMGKEPYLAQWYYDTLCSLLPQAKQLHMPIESLGPLDTLVQRLQDEVEIQRLLRAGLRLSGRGAANRYRDGRPLKLERRKRLWRKGTSPINRVGLFAARPIRAGTPIIEFKGRIISWEKAHSCYCVARIT